jgi:hypothetical protein
MKKDSHSKSRSIGRFWSQVERGLVHWYWKGGKNCRVLGYASRIPRRVAWRIDTGKGIPEGMDVESNCGDKDCICPQHMKLVPERPRSSRGAGMALLMADIREDHLAELEARARERGESKNHTVREVIAAGLAAFRSAEGSEGRAIAVSKNPTEK